MKGERSFARFFANGEFWSTSPFLTPLGRVWAGYVPLAGALCAAILLLLAAVTSSVPLVGVYLIAGVPALEKAISLLAQWRVDIDILMTLSAFFSLLLGNPLEGGLLLVLFHLSTTLEKKLTERASRAVIDLKELQPRYAWLLEDGGKKQSEVEKIRVGQRIVVPVGSTVPLDGKVVVGTGEVELAHLSGESKGVSIAPGDEVAAGAALLGGSIEMVVTRTSKDSTLARIVQLVANADKPTQKPFIEQHSGRYALAILSIAFLSLLFDLSSKGVRRVLSFLVSASPCALVVATPAATLSAISSCARRGILLKSSSCLEPLANCKKIAFDKTGTLTKGMAVCRGVERKGIDCLTDRELLAAAATLEESVTHPLAAAIVKYAAAQGVSGVPSKEIRVEQRRVHGWVWLREEWRLAEIAPVEEGIEVSLGEDSVILHCSDQPREEAFSLIGWLKKQNISVMILTGDGEKAATAVARELGIERVLHSLRPADKLAEVGRGIVMIGDGINDAPALRGAEVGIALAELRSAAAGAADVVITEGNLMLIAELIDVARQTVRVVYQNLVIASCVIVFMAVPALQGRVPLWLAVTLHEGGTLLAVLNGLRLLWLKKSRW